MNSSFKSRLKRSAPSALIVLLLFVLSAWAFLPIFRAKAEQSVASYSLDNEAVRVFNAASAYVQSHDFDAKLEGSVRAKVFGIPYTQKVSGLRSMRGEDYSDVAESASAFVKAAIKKEYKSGEFLISRGEYKNKNFVYSAPVPIDRDEFIAAYGLPVTGLVKYETEGSIVDAQCLGENTYRYVLDVSRATTYCRNEVKTALGGKSYPEYQSIEIVLRTDGERPQSVSVTERFRVDKFGGVRCEAIYNETFLYADTPMPLQ